jgi:hypothetical protein
LKDRGPKPSTEERPPAENPAGFMSRHYPIVVALVVASIALWLTQISHSAPPSVRDALGYIHTAQQLLVTGTYAWGTAGTSAPNAITTPGYSLVLAAVYAFVPRGQSEVQWAQAARPFVTGLQMLMVLGIVACITRAGRLLGGKRVALVAGVLAAIYTPYGFATSVALSDLFGALLIAGSLLASLAIVAPRRTPRTAHFVALGLLTGAVALVRPIYLLWAVFPVIYLIAARTMPAAELVKKLTVLGLMVVVVMAPWWIRNEVTLHQLVLLNTNGGDTMLDATGGRQLTPTEQAIADAADARGKDGASVVAMERITSELRSSPGEFFGSRSARALSVVLSPWNAVLDGAWENNNDPDVQRIDYGEFPPAPTPLFVDLFFATRAYQWVLLVGGVIGVLFVRKSPRILLVASLPLYSVAAHYFTVFIDRYFLPAMAGVILLAATGIVGVYLLARRGVGALRGRANPSRTARPVRRSDGKPTARPRH